MNMHPREVAFISAEDATAIGLPAESFGLLFCTDEHGKRWTVVTGDIEYVEMLRDAPSAALAGMRVPQGKFPMRRAGWPDEWAEDAAG